MYNLIKKIFWPPVFKDEDKSRRAANLNALLWVSLILLTTLRIFSYLTESNRTEDNFFTNPITILVGVMAILLIVMRLGFIRETSFILLIAAWAALNFQARNSGGIFDTAFTGNFVIIILAGLLLSSWAGMFFAALTILSGWGLAYLQVNNIFTATIDIPYNVARDNTVIFILISAVSYFTINGLQNALKRSSADTTELLISNQQLKALRDDLEKRVDERTLELKNRSNELENVSNNNQHRATQLQAVAQVGRAITSIQSLQSLLPRVAGVISKQFSLDHVGIFLLDDAKEYAILSATNSLGGQRMLERNHKLLVGQEGIVGQVARAGLPRIASDTGVDTAYRNNPDLPNTRSEMAIPLKFGGEIIGILDLQSELSSAFGEQDIELLTIVADQVAIAIQNARRFQETQKANRDAETLYGETVHKQWVAYTLDRDNIGYRYSGTSIHPLEQRVENSNIRLAIQNKASRFTQETTGSKLAVPIQLRGQVIGVLNIEYQGKRTWNQDEIDITKSIAERVSLAIENARLLQDAQSRAAKERVIGDIASKLSSSNNMDIIFQTAAKELGLVIPDAEVIVQFLSEVNDED